MTKAILRAMLVSLLITLMLIGARATWQLLIQGQWSIPLLTFGMSSALFGSYTLGKNAKG